jgi:hypothetical protein
MNNMDDRPVLREIREKLAGLMKDLDDFVNFTETRIIEMENNLDNKIKEYATLAEKQRNLENDKKQLISDKQIFSQEKQANRVKSIALDNREKELEDKIKRVQTILT